MNDHHLQSCLNRGLLASVYDVASQAGSTRWSDASQRADLQSRWGHLTALLRWHTGVAGTELSGRDPASARAVRDIDAQHRYLAGWMDELDGWFERLLREPSDADGQVLHHDLNRFVAELVRHLDDEESLQSEPGTRPVKPSTPGGSLLADMPRSVLIIAVRCTLPAIDDLERIELLKRVTAERDDVTTDALFTIADRALDRGEALALRASLAGHPIADRQPDHWPGH